jgi:branched-chain amino acid transport system substrate-binding protein
MKHRSTLRAFALVVASLFMFGSARAEIVIGQTTGLSGPVAASAKETGLGASLYLDAINARNGINGQKIKLVSLDDKFDPKLAGANARKLITEHGAVALFLNRGTPHTEQIIPVLDEFNVPLIGSSSGAMILHTPVKKHVFNVRSTYQREAEKSIDLLRAMAIETIGLIYVDDSFGADVLVGLKKGFDNSKLKPAFSLKFDRTKPDWIPFAEAVKQSKPQAIIVISSGAHFGEAMTAARAAGSRAQLLSLSHNASAGFVKLLGDNARGTIVTQVFPNERSISSPLVKELRALAKDKNINEVSPAMVEGFAAAKVLVEALRRAGAKPTGEKIRDALDKMRAFDLGGMTVSYSPSDHTGLDFVDLSIIGKDGKFTR